MGEERNKNLKKIRDTPKSGHTKSKLHGACWISEMLQNHPNAHPDCWYLYCENGP